MSINPNDLAALSGMYENAGALQLKEIEQRFKLGKAQLANALKIAQINSKDTRYGIETQRDIAREQIAQARLEMEKLGIPRLELDKWQAEKTYELAQVEMALKREVAEAELTGEFQGNPTLAARKMEQELGLAEGELTGVYNGQQTLAGRQQGLDEGERARVEAERQRRYALDVAQFGAGLASTPDTYFQARRFQGVDVPRLLGGAGAQTSGPTGGPTPGVATMGSYLSGADPYGPQPVAAAGAGARPSWLQPEQYAQWDALPEANRQQYIAGQSAPTYAGATPTPYATPYGGAAPMAAAVVGGTATPAQQAARGTPGAGWANTEGVSGATPAPWDAQAIVDSRPKQIAQIVKASPPSPYDGLNDQDSAALRLMESIYKKGGQQIAGGEMERLKASGRMGFMQSAGRLLGYAPSDLESQYQAYRPTQGDARLAG